MKVTVIPPVMSRAPEEEIVVQVEPTAKRRCQKCLAILSRYNNGPLCAACRRSEKRA